MLIGLIFLTCNLTWGQSRTFDEVSYFPKSVYSGMDKVDSMMFIWRSQMMRDFDEPRLGDFQSNSVYRFTWTRSFHEAMTFRLNISGGEGILIRKTEIKQLQSQDRREKVNREGGTSMYRSDTIYVDSATVDAFNSLMAENHLWTMDNTWGQSVIHDGAGWLFEAADIERGYKMLYRQSPDEETEKNFRDICLFLIRLTKDFDELEIY